MNGTIAKRIERAERNATNATDQPIWAPLPGPQTMAYECTADVVGYGGAAGGGKTDLAIGKALTQHQRVAIFRRHSTETLSIIDRLADVLGHRDGLNTVAGIWRLGERVIEFGSVPNLGDETKYMGRAKDLLVLDEAANFLEAQVRFLQGWVRTTDPNQHCQTLLCFNPPTSAEGRWIVSYFAPWLDKKHSNPAQPGELRWFAMIDGKEIEVQDGGVLVHDNDIIIPQSRTFIPARVSDNPHLAGTGYVATLQALPEPLRSQMLNGDFEAGMEDDAAQVIPTAWVEAAMARWTELSPKPPMDSVGVDVARGGKDNTIISRRHGMWFDKLLAYPGMQTPDGPTAAGLVVAAGRDYAVINVDVIGVGASVFDFLVDARQDVYGVNVAEGSSARDKSGRLDFFNLRSELVWRMREALDPMNNTGIALPPDSRLLADLCAYTWKLGGNGQIRVESRDEVIKRIGRSPDYASGVLLALIDTPKSGTLLGDRPKRSMDYNPLEQMSREMGRRDAYDQT